MPRPCHPRHVHADLQERVFKPRGLPLGEAARSELSLDGLEALRLADGEGLYQEAAAERMGVSRATFARILAEARRTVAEALVEGKALVIGGGEITRRDADRWPCPVHGARRRRGRGCHCAAHRVRGGSG